MSQKENDNLNNFSIQLQIPVAWGEMDSFNHVNNIIYFRYFESSRMKYFEKVGFNELMNKEKIGPILGYTDCKFILPVTYPDNLTVGSKVIELNETSFLMEYKIISEKLQKVVCIGHGKIVCYDYQKLSKTQIPESIFKNIQKLDNL